MGHGSSKLTKEELNQFHLDSNLSNSKIQYYYNFFMKNFKGNCSTRDEFQDAYQVYFLNGQPSAFAAHLFRSLDTNSDGVVDFKEFIRGLGIMFKGEEEEKMKLAFRIYDIDGDGYISREELVELIEALSEMVLSTRKLNQRKLKSAEDSGLITETFANQLLYFLDKNHDNKISLGEFIEGSKQYPLLLDVLESGHVFAKNTK